MTTQKRPTTKEDVKQLIQLWPTNTVAEIAEKLGRNVNWVHGMRSRLKKANYVLPKKTGQHGSAVRKMVEELVAELNANGTAQKA